MKIYPNSNSFQIASPSHPVFKYVEEKFNEWFAKYTAPGAPMGRDIHDMYYSEDAIYTKKGAIQQAIENAIEEANETGKPVDLAKFDIECAFE